MRFIIQDEGYIHDFNNTLNNYYKVLVGSRCSIKQNGDIICTYMMQSKKGINDFKPVLSESSDGGKTWVYKGDIWSDPEHKKSIFCSISLQRKDYFILYGTITPIDYIGEPFWNVETNGLKQNQLFYAKLIINEQGFICEDPQTVPVPIICSMEAPGAMCITNKNRWIAPFAPYNTFDPNVYVERNRIVNVISDDEGKTWRYNDMIRFPDKDMAGAEAWVIQLTSGVLLGVCWNYSLQDGTDYPNQYTLSFDEGESWIKPKNTGITGQACAVTPLPNGKALFVYNQRKKDPVGIGLAYINPNQTSFGIEHNEVIWQAEKPTGDNFHTDYSEWTDFSFGEPSITALSERSFLVSFWSTQPGKTGIRYIKLLLDD